MPEIKKTLCNNMDTEDSKLKKSFKSGDKFSYAELCLYLYIAYKKDP